MEKKAIERVERVRHILEQQPQPSLRGWGAWRKALYHIVFEADTRAGKAFDLGLIVVILVSLVAVMAESVDHINRDYGSLIKSSEWIITALFSAEYILRLLIVRRPWRYARSFFGIVDLLSVLPSYLSFFFAGAQALAVIRVLRVLRIFRLLKLPQFVGEAEYLATALALSTRKIVVFLGSVVTLVVILGAVMYLVEGPESGFDSIPRSMYWAVVTLTTVGYGDIAPKSAAGQAISALVMILGYAIIAVPTGIVSAEMVAARRSLSVRACPECLAEGHESDALFCKRCSARLLTVSPQLNQELSARTEAPAEQQGATMEASAAEKLTEKSTEIDDA